MLFDAEPRQSLLLGCDVHEALQAFKKWTKSFPSDAWLDFEALAPLAQQACKSEISQSSSCGSVHNAASWDSQLVSSRRLLPESLSQFLHAFQSEVDRSDAVLSRDMEVEMTCIRAHIERVRRKLSTLEATQYHQNQELSVWTEETKCLLDRVSQVALMCHAHRVLCLWLVSQFSRNALDVAALLVMVERKRFWNESTEPALDMLGEGLLLCHRAQKIEQKVWKKKSTLSSGSSEDVTMMQQSNGGSGGGGNKLTKRQKKKLIKIVDNPHPVIPASTSKDKVSATYTVWIRPSLAQTVLASLLSCCIPAEVVIKEGLDRSTRMYLDNDVRGAFRNRMQHNHRDVDDGVDSVVLYHMEWIGIGADAVAFNALDRKSNVLKKTSLSPDDAQDILWGKGEKTLAGPDGLMPRAAYRVTSRRKHLVHTKNKDVVLTWDSDMFLSKATPPPLKKKSVSMLSWTECDQSLLFPFSVVTITAFNDATISKDLLKILEGGTLIHVPGFDEHCAAVAMFDKGVEQPVWQALVDDALKNDWMHVMNPKNQRLPASKLSDELVEEVDLLQGLNLGAVESPDPSEIEGDEEDTPLVPLSPDGRKKRARLVESASKDAVKQDPKSHWANERTLLSWMSLAIFIGISAVSLLSTSSLSRNSTKITFTQIAGFIMSPLAIAVAMYALIRFHFRQQSIMNQSMRGVIDVWGPWILVPVICLSLVVMTLTSFL